MLFFAEDDLNDVNEDVLNVSFFYQHCSINDVTNHLL